MCGIVGVLDTNGGLPEPEIFDAMVDSLAHRGPDGRGVWAGEGVLLGHRRLAILDPTPAGAQPMAHQEGDIVVTYNGEIYNFRELRSELEGLGHSFKTECDTEVLLAAYVEWGTAAVHRLRGIFAFGLWDNQRRRLWLVRDHLGVKPLCYSTEDGRLSFASEAQALLANPAQVRRANLIAIDQFLSLCYVPAPRTGFDAISTLPPGHHATWEDGEFAVQAYWTPTIDEREISFSNALGEFSERLHQSVAAQMISDVPLGAFLSGGLDSAAIVAEMVRKAGGDQVRSYSMGFVDATFDESDSARETAAWVGSQHHAAQVPLDLADTVLKVVDGTDDLFADSSALAVFHLCKMTRAHVTVALSGDGADELLAGYPTYVATYLSKIYRGMPNLVRAVARGAVGQMKPSVKRYNLQQFASAFVQGAEMGEYRDFASWRAYLRDEDKLKLTRQALRPEGFDDPFSDYAAQLAGLPPETTLLKRMLFADLTFYLPNDMLVKVDRMSMRHSLEVRVPFLDPDFVDFCLGLPSRFLLSAMGKKKKILKHHLATVGLEGVARRKKLGFNVPVAAAFQSTLGDLLRDAIRTEPFKSNGPLDPVAVEALLDAHQAGREPAGFPLYVILVLALWWNRWL